jgi:hypothetical protein
MSISVATAEHLPRALCVHSKKLLLYSSAAFINLWQVQNFKKEPPYRWFLHSLAVLSQLLCICMYMAFTQDAQGTYCLKLYVLWRRRGATRGVDPAPPWIEKQRADNSGFCSPCSTPSWGSRPSGCEGWPCVCARWARARWLRSRRRRYLSGRTSRRGTTTRPCGVREFVASVSEKAHGLATFGG